MQANLGPMFERKYIFISLPHAPSFSLFTKNLRAKQDCMQTSPRTKTSARLKITFVDITYPGQRLEPPSLSPHFLLVGSNVPMRNESTMK